jgi:hypothetical protein
MFSVHVYVTANVSSYSNCCHDYIFVHKNGHVIFFSSMNEVRAKLVFIDAARIIIFFF